MSDRSLPWTKAPWGPTKHLPMLPWYQKLLQRDVSVFFEDLTGMKPIHDTKKIQVSQAGVAAMPWLLPRLSATKPRRCSRWWANCFAISDLYEAWTHGVVESWSHVPPGNPEVFSQAPLYYGATRGWNPETLKPREFWQHRKLAFWDNHEKGTSQTQETTARRSANWIWWYDHTKTCWKYLYIKAARSKIFPHKPRKTDDALQPSYSHNKSQYQPEQEHIKNNCTRRCQQTCQAYLSICQPQHEGQTWINIRTKARLSLCREHTSFGFV